MKHGGIINEITSSFIELNKLNSDSQLLKKKISDSEIHLTNCIKFIHAHYDILKVYSLDLNIKLKFILFIQILKYKNINVDNKYKFDLQNSESSLYTIIYYIVNQKIMTFDDQSNNKLGVFIKSEVEKIEYYYLIEYLKYIYLLKEKNMTFSKIMSSKDISENMSIMSILQNKFIYQRININFNNPYRIRDMNIKTTLPKIDIMSSNNISIHINDVQKILNKKYDYHTIINNCNKNKCVLFDQYFNHEHIDKSQIQQCLFSGGSIIIPGDGWKPQMVSLLLLDELTLNTKINKIYSVDPLAYKYIVRIDTCSRYFTDHIFKKLVDESDNFEWENEKQIIGHPFTNDIEENKKIIYSDNINPVGFMTRDNNNNKIADPFNKLFMNKINQGNLILLIKTINI
jgi:hypothetical protein